MNAWLGTLAGNAIEATVLATAMAIVFAIRKPPPTLRHALWLLVLVKLATPPVAIQPLGLSAAVRGAGDGLFGLDAREDAPGTAREHAAGTPGSPSGAGLASTAGEASPAGPAPLPRPDAGPAEGGTRLDGADLAALEDGDGREPSPTAPPPRLAATGDGAPEPDGSLAKSGGSALVRTDPWVRSLLGAAFVVWIAGAAAVAALHLVRILAFRLRSGPWRPAGPEVERTCADLARTMGLRRAPRVRTTARRVPPFLWVPGFATVVIPRVLAADPGAAGRLGAILAHELAHLVRRDHWVSWLELAVTCAYWWLPTPWLILREIRTAADLCADARAVRSMGTRRSYARSLFETVEFLCAGTEGALPGVAPGRALVRRERLERRLEMILKQPLDGGLSPRAWLLVSLVAALSLPTAPAVRGQASPATPADGTSAPRSDPATEAPSSLDPPLELSAPPAPGGQPPAPVPLPPPPAATAAPTPAMPPAPPLLDGRSALPGVSENPGRAPAAGGRSGRGSRSVEARLSALEDAVAQILAEVRALHGEEWTATVAPRGAPGAAAVDVPGPRIRAPGTGRVGTRAAAVLPPVVELVPERRGSANIPDPSSVPSPSLTPPAGSSAARGTGIAGVPAAVPIARTPIVRESHLSPAQAEAIDRLRRRYEAQVQRLHAELERDIARIVAEGDDAGSAEPAAETSPAEEPRAPAIRRR